MGKRSARIDSDSHLLSSKNTWLNIVDYSVRNGMDLVVLTGDIVDRDNRYFEASGPLIEGLKILHDNNITTYVISGNHDFDVLPQILDSAELESVFFLGRGGNWESSIYEKEDTEIQFVGWSFPAMYVRNNPVDTFTTDILRDDMPTVMIVHGDVYSANTPYAPIDVEKLRAYGGIDAVLLGHIHKGDLLREAFPLIIYPGSPHALSPKERGTHGVCIVTVDGNAIGYDEIILSPVRYEELNVDVGEVIDEEDFRKLFSNSLRKFVATLEDTDYLAFLSLDIRLTGKNNRMREIEHWSRNLSEFNFRERFEVSVRKVEYAMEPKIDIDSLLDNPSYPGILANAIKDISDRRSNTFVEDLKKKWIERYEDMTSSKTYTPLALSAGERDIEHEAECAILRECENLLAELFIQGRDED